MHQYLSRIAAVIICFTVLQQGSVSHAQCSGPMQCWCDPTYPCCTMQFTGKFITGNPQPITTHCIGLPWDCSGCIASATYVDRYCEVSHTMCVNGPAGCYCKETVGERTYSAYTGCTACSGCTNPATHAAAEICYICSPAQSGHRLCEPFGNPGGVWIP